MGSRYLRLSAAGADGVDVVGHLHIFVSMMTMCKLSSTTTTTFTEPSCPDEFLGHGQSYSGLAEGQRGP
jgi:hypothetical protein